MAQHSMLKTLKNVQVEKFVIHTFWGSEDLEKYNTYLFSCKASAMYFVFKRNSIFASVTNYTGYDLTSRVSGYFERNIRK